MGMSENVSFGELLCGKSRDAEDFIQILSFCSDRLNKGQQVPAIWLDWKEKAGQK